MRILFLGGTSFVGRHIAEAAIAAGHDVTFFNRGRTNATLFPTNAHIIGDRERKRDVDVLETVDADVVIDTSGYTPDSVRATARAVAGRVTTYYFMSSVDVYAHPSEKPVDETTPTKGLPAGASTSERLPELYGAHKAECERELVAILGAERVIVVRAGLMVGPHDATERFTYWPVRTAQGGEMLAPVGRSLPIQFIDVRDVADWSIEALARGLHGTFNLVGMPQAQTIGDLIDLCQAVAKSRPRVVWVSSAFLESQNVGAWVELPLWIPNLHELNSFCAIRNDRALATGLRLRPLEQTVEDILADRASQPNDGLRKAGLSTERERELLASWRRMIGGE